MPLSNDIRLFRIFPVIIVIAVCFVVNGNALSNGFVYDDIPQVVHNSRIRDFRIAGNYQ